MNRPLKARSAVGRPRLSPAANVDPLVHTLFEHIDHLGVTYASIERAAGLAKNHLGKWKTGYATPNLVNMNAVCQTVGLRIEMININLTDPSV